ncbi:MAG: lipopolysaccharide biosynthesis protein [Pseudomonadales bacterium]
MARKSFIVNAGFYTSASFLSVVASLISFPILTRLFEVGEYGLLGLVTGTIPLLVGIGKIGMQHASIRFYSDVNSTKTNWNMAEYFSTLYLTLLLSAGLLFLVWNVLVMTIGETIFENQLICVLFVISSYIVFVRILESAMLNVLRAQEEALKHTIFGVTKRFLVLGVTLCVLFFYKADLVPYFIAVAATEAVMLVIFAYRHIPFKKIRIANFRPKLVKAMVVFGVPMFGMEFGGALMNVADRYIIDAYLGHEAVGAYTSAYTLVDYGQGIVATALIASAIPTFLRINTDDGLDAASIFVTGALRLYIWAAVPIVLILAAAGESILELLAGEAYTAGAVIMPWVALGIAFFGVFELVAAGLYLTGNTGKMFYIILMTAVANIVLNMICVPKYGLIGAAGTTLVCYLGCIAASYFWSRRYLRIAVPWQSLLKSIAAGMLMFLVLSAWSPKELFLEIAYKGSLGLILYILLLLLFDRDAKKMLLRALPDRATRLAKQKVWARAGA